jgi:hypothetical protein
MIPKLLTLLGLLLATSTGLAAQGELSPADSSEVANHVITDTEFARFALVVERMDSVYASSPNAFRDLKEGKPELPVALSYLASRYETHIAMGAELRRAGMTGREFFLVAAALVNARRILGLNDSSRADALSASEIANLRLAECRSQQVSRLFTILRTVS